MYGMLSEPNMKQINDANVSFWSPQPFFIAGFFFPQMLIQIAWLYRLYQLDSTKPGERADLDEMVDYTPIFILGNISIGMWMFFWNAEMLQISNLFVIINSCSQLYYVFGKLQPLDTNSTTSILTHTVAKMFAGIGVLDLVHNGSVAYFKDAPATMTVKVVTALGFGLLSAASDWILGGCLVYDLVALAVGQGGSWGQLLGGYAVGAAGIVAAKNLAR